jgi:cholesterol transport system auxiliary component
LKYFIGKQYATKIAAALFTLMLAGCSALRPTEAESVRTYLLEAQFDRTEQVKSIPLVLTVSPPRAAPGYNTDRMAYIRQPHLLEYFAKNRWAESPAKMLSPLLVRSMELRTGIYYHTQSLAHEAAHPAGRAGKLACIGNPDIRCG